MILLLDTTTNPTAIGLYELSPESSSRAKSRDFLNSLKIKVVESNPENNRKLVGIIKKFIDKSKIDAVGVINGPGTFTGVRTGVVIANAISYALKVPLYAKDTLTAQAPAMINDVVSLLSASNNKVYFSRFQRGKMIEKIELVDIINLGNRLNDGDIVVGDLGEKHCGLITKQEFIEKNSADRIKNLLDLILCKKIKPVKQVLPLYIKKPNITRPKKK